LVAFRIGDTILEWKKGRPFVKTVKRRVTAIHNEIASFQGRGKIAPEKENQNGNWQNERYHKTRMVTNSPAEFKTSQVAVDKSNMATCVVGYCVSQQQRKTIGKQFGVDSLSANDYQCGNKAKET
jgi:hypothetical protein